MDKSYATPPDSTNDNIRRAFWVFFIAAIIFVCSSIPNIEVSNTQIPYLDKIAHILIYGLLSTLIFRNKLFFKYGYTGAFLSIFLSTAYGISDEYHQSFTGRNCDIHDIFADLFGSLVAVFLYMKVSPYRKFLETKISLHGLNK